MIIIYILLAVLMFGLLIAVHEFGHFIAAKSLGVKVNEFAIGMGPALFKRQKGETLYSLRVLPVGGYCAMEGEDEDSEDPGAFTNKPPWKKIAILIAGSLSNFLVGLIILLLIYSPSQAFSTSTVDGFMEGSPLEEQGLMAGDRIHSIDGNRIYTNANVSMFIARGDDEYYDLVVVREGKKLSLPDFRFQLREFKLEGQSVLRYGLYFKVVPSSPIQVLKASLNSARDFARLVWLGLGDLIGGRTGMQEMSGPVGIVGAIVDVGEQSAGMLDAVANILYFAAFIAINLAVMNMLPIPALDGGRVFFVLVMSVVEKLRGRRVDPKYEGYVHMAGMVLLLGIMVYATFNDVLKLIMG